MTQKSKKGFLSAMTNEIKVELIGPGNNGRVHAKKPVYHTLQVKRAAFSKPYLKPSKKCAANSPLPTGYNNYRPMLTDKPKKAVFIDSATVPGLVGSISVVFESYREHRPMPNSGPATQVVPFFFRREQEAEPAPGN
jgi:hypothetical protein